MSKGLQSEIKKETSVSNNNKRIAKNTIMLYFRMAISMLISIYTSRVVLNVLGVSDYGIYGVVGGVIAMFSFLNASMSGATSRFLAYELGKGNSSSLQKTFCMAFYEHLIIAGLILFVCETFGLWFLNTKLVIPSERLFAANCVFQLSIISMCISVTQVPYSASIISHEKMNVFAYVEIINSILKLLIVYLLNILLFDKLILYSILIFMVSLSIALYYRLYCVLHFSECRLKLLWDSSIFKKMFFFSGWDLFGNMSVAARTQGVNLLLNIFFGPTINAASSIATTVQGTVMSFASNVSTAVKPQIIKYYAQGNYKEMTNLISNAIRLNYLILMFVTVPIITELPYILHLWLGLVPSFTVSFCTFTLIFNFYANMSFTLVTGIHATGKIVRPSLINGTLYLLVLPLSYLAFKYGYMASTPYLLNVFFVIIGMFFNAYTLNMYIKEFSLYSFFVKDFLPCVLVFIISISLCFLLKSFFIESFMRLLIVIIFSTLILSFTGYFFLLPKSLKKKIIKKVEFFLCKKN